MKKLLIAMTAAAVGTCAWAEGDAGGEGTEPTTPATPTMLNETFGANWELQAPWSYWSGAETATPAEGELTAGDALTLNTGSKVLRGNFMSDGSAKDIDTGLYFKSTVTFKDPSDTLPELKDSDKFALVVLDNVESCEKYNTEENPDVVTPATNLWVIAKYGESEQRAYQLNVEVTPSWLAEEHKIVVKAYENVMASGNCAGFLVKVDNEDNDTVCTVVQSCAIVNGVIDYGTSCAYNWWKDGDSGNLGYLGYPKAAILGAVQKRYTDATLILSNVPSSDTLASVDFQGQGVIDNVSLATTGEGFGTDSLALTVVADGVTLVDTDETLYFAAIGDKVIIKFRVNEGYELSSPTGLTAVDGVYTYEYTTTANNEKVTISAFEPKVSVVTGTDENGNPIVTKYGSLSEAIEEVAAGAELTLTGAITLTEAVEVTDNITINLNGKTLSATLTDEFASMFALADGKTLTITDTTGGVLQITGEVDDRLIAKGPDRGNAAVAINAGTIKADIANENSITYALTGGQYDTDVSAVLGGNYVATKAEGSEYWTVAEKVIEEEEVFEESKDLVDVGEGTLTEEQETAVEATFGAIAGDATDKDAAVTNYFTTVYGANVKVPVATITGAKNVDISVKYNLPLMTEEAPTVEITTEAAAEGDAAAFSFQIKDGDNAVAVAAAVEKVRSMIQYGAELNSMATLADDNTDVVCSVDANAKKIKVQLKSGKNKGFMKVKLR